MRDLNDRLQSLADRVEAIWRRLWPPCQAGGDRTTEGKGRRDRPCGNDPQAANKLDAAPFPVGKW